MESISRNDIIEILTGKRRVGFSDNIQAAANYLRNGKRASGETEKSFKIKAQEAEILKKFIVENNLWLKDEFNKYLVEGAEQKVYWIDNKYVLKVNDTIFYESWIDYFSSLLLHNFFFTTTKYELVGFIQRNDVLFSVVKQPFIKSDSATNLQEVNQLLTEIGFRNTRNNDYYSEDLGIILEDLHDENVITQSGQLFFIDTVFYLTWNPS